MLTPVQMGVAGLPLDLTSVGFVRLLVQQYGMAAVSPRAAVRCSRPAAPLCGGRPTREPRVQECTAPALEWYDSRLAVFRALDCSQDDAVGPYDGDHLQVLHTLTVREPGSFELRAIAERPDSAVSLNAVVLTPCAGCGGGLPIRVYAGERLRADLTAGRYSLRWMGPAAVPTTLGFLLERVDGAEPGVP
jgi:hypothetical protein